MLVSCDSGGGSRLPASHTQSQRALSLEGELRVRPTHPEVLACWKDFASVCFLVVPTGNDCTDCSVLHWLFTDSTFYLPTALDTLKA